MSLCYCGSTQRPSQERGNPHIFAITNLCIVWQSDWKSRFYVRKFPFKKPLKSLLSLSCGLFSASFSKMGAYSITEGGGDYVEVEGLINFHMKLVPVWRSLFRDPCNELHKKKTWLVHMHMMFTLLTFKRIKEFFTRL